MPIPSNIIIIFFFFKFDGNIHELFKRFPLYLQLQKLLGLINLRVAFQFRVNNQIAKAYI